MNYKAIAEKQEEIIELLWKAIGEIPEGLLELKRELQALESDQSSVTADPNKVLMRYVDCTTVNYNWPLIIKAMEEYAGCQPKGEVYPDTEADGYVFCGKCGKMK